MGTEVPIFSHKLTMEKLEKVYHPEIPHLRNKEYVAKTLAQPNGALHERLTECRWYLCYNASIEIPPSLGSGTITDINGECVVPTDLAADPTGFGTWANFNGVTVKDVRMIPRIT